MRRFSPAYIVSKSRIDGSARSMGSVPVPPSGIDTLPDTGSLVSKESTAVLRVSLDGRNIISNVENASVGSRESPASITEYSAAWIPVIIGCRIESGCEPVFVTRIRRMVSVPTSSHPNPIAVEVILRRGCDATGAAARKICAASPESVPKSGSAKCTPRKFSAVPVILSDQVFPPFVDTATFPAFPT